VAGRDVDTAPERRAAVIGSLALTSLRRRPLRTFLTALGIAVAVGSTVIFLSLGEGMRRAFAQELRGLGPDLQVSFGPFDGTVFTAVPELPLRYLDTLEAEAERYGITSVTPILLYVRGSLATSTAFVFYGVPADLDPRSLYADFELIAGRSLDPAVPDALEAVIGEQAARRAGMTVGDSLRLNPRASFEIVGVGRATGGLFDNAILVPLPALQEAIGTTDRVSFLALDLRVPEQAARTAVEIAAAYPELGVQTRGDISSIFERGMQITDVVRLGISGIALIVGAIAVANTMLMSVFERTREFGVVRAVGARPRFLFGLVLIEALLLSLVGAAAGIVLGQVGAHAVNVLAFEVVGVEVAAVTPRLVAFAVAVAAAMGLLAGLLPAARAARIPIAVAVARE
jgi:putative ABC transport system permease protein